MPLRSRPDTTETAPQSLFGDSRAAALLNPTDPSLSIAALKLSIQLLFPPIP